MKPILFVLLGFLAFAVSAVGGGNSVKKTGPLDGVPTEVWVSAGRTDGKGNGTQADPFDAHTQLAFQAVIDKLPARSTVRMADGVYPRMNLAIAKSLTILGSRKSIITPQFGANKPIFELSGQNTDFILNGISLIHGTVFVEEKNVAAIMGGCRRVRVTDIYSSDFNNTIYITDRSTQELDVDGCNFEYTNGRASVSNFSPYQHPCAAIVGNPRQLVVKNNEFNGLVDPTFASVSDKVPVSQRQAADNFVQTGDHSYCLVEGNRVQNFGIEGIFIARGNVSGDYTVRIANNNMVGTVYHNQTDSPTYAPGIKLFNSRGEIVGNTISKTNIGISTEFGRYDEAANVVTISANTVNRCLLGIEGIRVSDKSIFNANKVWNTSEPVRTVWGPKAFPTELYGIVTDHGHVTNNTLISDEPVWDGMTTLVSRSGNTFTVSSAAGISAHMGALVSYANGGFAIFPVQTIKGNDVTVHVDYAISYPNVSSGTLYYARSFANGTSNGGVVVRTGGTVYADGNLVIGHRNDISQQNSGSIVVTNHTTRNCHVVQTTVAGVFKPERKN